MIKVKQGNKMILGFSDENLIRLKNGEPIKFNMNELGFDNIEVIVLMEKMSRQ